MSLESVVKEIFEAGLDGRVKRTEEGYRIDVRTGPDKQGKERCIRGVLPRNEEEHVQFARMLVQEARTKILEQRSGKCDPVGTQTKVSLDDIKLVERVS
jgi:hypothetical protein